MDWKTLLRILRHLKRNGNTFATVGMIIQTVAILLQTIIAAIMLYSLTLSQESIKVAEQQFRASVEPDLRFLPSHANAPAPNNFNFATQPGVFNFTVKNSGADDLEEIYIYEDTFAVFWSPTNALQLLKVPDGFIYNASPFIDFLIHGCEINYTFNITNRISQFKQFESSPIYKGKIARIRIDFRRKSDGHQFSTTKIFMVGSDFTSMTDESSHGLPWQWPQFIPYDDIRRTLGGQ